jgi:hypothetical protein
VFFNQEFIEWVEDNPLEGVVESCLVIAKELGEEFDVSRHTDAKHEFLWDVSSFINLIITLNNLAPDIELPEPSTSIGENCSALMKYLAYVERRFSGEVTKIKIESYKSRYANVLKASFAYEFSQGDLDRVQALVNEIREHISANADLDDEHKQRLLKRLELLQSELHKRVSDLDRFWGLVGDAGVVMGKLGTDAKPIVDRIKEVAEIVWKTQARTEELPSDSGNPVLGQSD